MREKAPVRTVLGLVAVVVGVVVLALGPAPARPVGLVLLGGVAALLGHERGLGLGLGAWSLAPVAPAGPGLVAAVALLTALVARLLHHGDRVGRRSDAALAALSLATAGTVAGLLGSRWGVPAAALGWLAVLGVSVRLAGRDVRSLVLDAAGWAVGILYVRWERELGTADAAAFVGILALLAGEAARQSAGRRRAGARVGSLERLREAHVRILGETSGFGGIAAQIWIECRNVLPVHWMELRRAETGEVWSVGPEGRLREGPATPPKVPPALPGIHRRAGWRVLGHVLEVEDRALGELRLWCDPRRIGAGEEDLLGSLVPQMASAVHRAELDREARLDPLTEVPVRRILDRELQRTFAAACEEGGQLAVVMCDVDHFKRINDTFGHATGDLVLQGVARTLDRERRERDLLCRYGGEEFTLLLADTGGDAALRLADRLRRAVGELAWELPEGPLGVTMSAGVAAFPEVHVKTGSELLLLADEALYRAKEDGRNRCLLRIGRESFRGPDEPERPPGEPRIPRIFA